MAEGRKGFSFHDLPGNPTTPYRPPQEEPVDDLQHYMDATTRQRERAEKAEAALAQERERVRELREECEKRGLPVSAKALAQHERKNGEATGGAQQLGDVLKAERQRDELVEGLKLIAEHATEERNPDGDEQAAWSMRLIARDLLASIQHNPAASPTDKTSGGLTGPLLASDDPEPSEDASNPAASEGTGGVGWPE